MVSLPLSVKLRIGVPASSGLPVALLLGRLSEGEAPPASREDDYFVAAGSLNAGVLHLNRASFRIEEQAFADDYANEAARALELRPWKSWRWLGTEHVTVSDLPAYCRADIAAGSLQLFLLTAAEDLGRQGYRAFVLLPD